MMIEKVAYKLGLLLDIKVDLVFHVCSLKPFYNDGEDPKRSTLQWKPILQRHHQPSEQQIGRWSRFFDTNSNILKSYIKTL